MAKYEAIDVKMVFYSNVDKPHFHKKGFALSLVLKVRVFLELARKWPIYTRHFRAINDSVFYAFFLAAECLEVLFGSQNQNSLSSKTPREVFV